MSKSSDAPIERTVSVISRFLEKQINQFVRQILIVAQGGGFLPRERTVRPVALAIAPSAISGVEAYFLTCSLICSLVGARLSATLGTSTGASARGRKSSSVGGA